MASSQPEITDLQRTLRARASIDQFAIDTVSAQAASCPTKFHFWHDAESCVPYVDTGSAWVAAGRPAAPPEARAAAAERFVAEARANGRRARFFGVEAPERDSKRLLAVGAQASWTPDSWSAALTRKKSLREQLRRARAKGVAVEAVEAVEHTALNGALRREVEALRQAWLAGRGMSPMQFVAHTDVLDGLDRRTLFVARHGEQLAGVLVATPVRARRAWMFEHLLRSPTAPNGTAETLFDAAVRAAAEQGVERVTLGLSPLANVSSWWLRGVRRVSRPLYDFNGLCAFKQKLEPAEWSPVFVSLRPGELGALAVFDTLAAFAGRSMLSFGWSSLTQHIQWRRPAAPKLLTQSESLG